MHDHWKGEGWSVGESAADGSRVAYLTKGQIRITGAGATEQDAWRWAEEQVRLLTCLGELLN